MSSRSSSSSSDILGPAGDSEYLLSSPTKPLGGRQPFMSMSPAPNFKFLQTPGSVKGKRQRPSLSPSKSAHSIRFDDVLLPTTPALAKLAGGQPMSLSPEKGQGESGNPWRIRVTLEATQDEEDEANNQKSPTRRALYPSTTMTTKVPLKDERDQPEPTPRRRRGRPRKTEIQALPNATSTPASPGHTPGAKGANGQSRPRGRPRKGTPAPVERQVEEQPTPVPDPEQSSPLNLEQPTPVPVPGRQRSSHFNFDEEEQPTPASVPDQQRYDPFNLESEDQPTPGTVPGRQRFSHLNLDEEEQPTPASVPDQQRYDPFNLESEDQPTPGPEFEQRSSPLNFEQPTSFPDSGRKRYSPLNPGVEEQLNPDSELDQERYSPLNLGADGDSEDDELPDAPFSAYEEDETMRPDPTDWNRSSPRVTFAEPAYETPDVGAIDRDDDDGKLHSTPSKMPSSVRQESIQEPLNSSPENALNAGRTPRPPRLYPTPTSSSLVDEENHEQDNLDEEVPSSELHDTQGEATDNPTDDYDDPTHEHRDPTDEHREYDSIVESEGFSMVSLDTLPSAKQHGISTNSDRAKGPLRPFLQRESIGKREKTKRKASSMSSDYNGNARANASPNFEPVNEPPRKRQSRSPPKRQSHSPVHRRKSEQPATHDEVSEQHAPPSPPAEPPAPTPADNRPRQITRLARIVRAGMALEGAFRQNPEVEKRPGSKIAIEEPKQRLESVFSDLDYDTQQQLRAGLGLGQEIAKRKIQAEVERERAEQEEAAKSAVAQDKHDQYEDEVSEEEEEDTSETPRQQDRRSVQDTPGPETAMKRRMAEWQQERESISREIDKANSSKVIVINSDDEAQQSPERGRAYPAFDIGGPDSESGSDFDQGPELEPASEGNLPEDDAGYPDEAYETDEVGEEQEDAEAEEQEEYEEERYPQPHMQQQEDEAEDEQYPPEEGEDDDGYSDIWQQEAQEHSQISHQSSTHQGSMHQSSTRRDKDDAGYRQESSPWKDDRSAAPSEYDAFSPAPWTHQRERVPYLGGQSRVQQLRKQEVDMSMLLGASNTPNHSRYYYGRSSPLSAASARPSQRAAPQSSPRYAENGVHGQEQPLSELGLVSSPLKHSDDDAFQIDPTTRIEYERMQFDRRRDQEEEDFEYSDAAVAEERSIDGNVEMTPQPPRPANPANPDVQGSTWFQRLASLTPGWLKAPIRRSPSRPSRVSEEYEDSDDDPVSDDGSAEDANAHSHGSDGADVEEQDEMERRLRSSRRFTEWRQYEEPQSSPESRAAQQPDRAFSALGEESPVRARPLAVSGHFSDEHYIILRRLYRLAAHFPERFPYYPAPGRDQIIGDWIWTSDGRHGVPVTEGQFAVIDQFVQELTTGDLDSGGTGQIGWTEADLHRRLISVIIGEKIRAERKAKTSGGDM